MQAIRIRSIAGAAMVAALGALVVGSTAGAADLSGPYKVAQRIVLGGTGKWDYTALDAQRHRLYVTRGDHVEVMDTVALSKSGEIPGTSGVHGVAFAQDLKRGYTSNGKADSVTVFDLDTLAVREQYKVPGHGPDALFYDPATHWLLVFNGRSKDLAVLDARDGKVVRTIALPGKPEFAAIDGTRVFVNLEDTDSLAAVDFAAGTVTGVWKLPECDEPTGLAYDAADRRIFSACGNGRLVVTDAASGRAVASLAVGKGPDAAIFDAARHRVFSSGGADGTLTIVSQQDADHYAVEQVLDTARSARTMTMEPESGRIFLPAPAEGDFTVVVAAPVR